MTKKLKEQSTKNLFAIAFIDLVYNTKMEDM